MAHASRVGWNQSALEFSPLDKYMVSLICLHLTVAFNRLGRKFLLTEGKIMNTLKYLALFAFAAIFLMVSAPKMNAQVSVGVNIGPAPDCPYGYYDTAPYGCAPYGYYGPEWFTDGVFIGAGPWFHGSDDFRGHVNNRYHPDHGYKGPMPKAGDKPEPSKRPDKATSFKGNEVRDGRGHTAEERK